MVGFKGGKRQKGKTLKRWWDVGLVPGVGGGGSAVGEKNVPVGYVTPRHQE